MEIVYKILKILSNRNTSLYIYIYIYIYKDLLRKGRPRAQRGQRQQWDNRLINILKKKKKKTHQGMEEIGRVLQDEEKETQSAKRWAISLDDL